MTTLTLARTIGIGVLGSMMCFNAHAQVNAQVDIPIHSDPAAALAAKSPTAVPVPARSVQTAIEIDAVVLEIDRSLGIDFDFNFDEKPKNVKLSSGTIEVIPNHAKEVVIKSLVESKHAKVISRPRIITIDGKQANVHVGGVVKLPFGENGKAVEHEVGLKLNVRPTTSGKKLRLDLECEYSRLNGKDRIETQKIDTQYEVASGDTMMISGFGNNQLVLFLTPKKLPESFAHPSPIPARIQQRIVAKPNPSSPAIAQRTVSPMTIARPAPTVSRPAPLTLEEALQRIFPSEHLEVIYLPNAIVLSGTVSEKGLPGILAIAEQYSPTVISNLTSKSSDDVAVRSNVPPGKIGEQLEQIRNDVLMLRKEVKKLSKLLQSKPAVIQTSGIHGRPVGLRPTGDRQKVPADSTLPVGINPPVSPYTYNGTRELQLKNDASASAGPREWKLTLDEVNGIGVK